MFQHIDGSFFRGFRREVYAMEDKYVFHIDANSAFLSWSAAYRVLILGEKLDYRTIPSIVGGDQESRHGIVLAKSTPAKKFGIHTGEAIVAAKKKCPHLAVLPPDYHLYVEASRALMAILHKYSDHVTQYSIDEAWAEFSGFRGMYGGMVTFANELREEIKKELGFTVNIGVSTNYLLAKMAGDLKKPDMVHTLFPWEIQKKMWPLPVGELFFVGRSTEKKLQTLGILTIGDLAKSDPNMLKMHMKMQGEVVWNFAWGRELMPFLYHQEESKGYGNSMTAPTDCTSADYAKELLLSLSETVGMRLRADNVTASCLSVSITTCEFERYSRQMQLMSATDVTEEIYHNACRVFDQMWNDKEGRPPIRQIGVHTTKLLSGDFRQISMFEQMDYEKCVKVNRAVDTIRDKFGENSIMRARFIDNKVQNLGGGVHKERRTGITAGIHLEKEVQV